MGRFYDMFYKREPVQDVVHVTLPPGFATPHGYGALMSIDFAACEQTKARSMASLPFSVMQAGRDGHKRLEFWSSVDLTGNQTDARLLGIAGGFGAVSI